MPSRVRRLALAALAVFLAVLPATAQDKEANPKSAKGFGLSLNNDATPGDVGLPVYPGAQRQKDTEEESSAVNMAFWNRGGSFRLVVLKLTSDDTPDKVAAFYRKALAKYGAVLDCNAQPQDRPHSALSCDADERTEGGVTLKAGTKQKQHAVAIERNGSHSTIALVYVEDTSDDN